MLAQLIRKEILDQLLSLRFIILSAITALAIWVSLYGGYAYYQDRLKDYWIAQTMTEERVSDLKEVKSFDDLVQYGFKEHKPPVPTSIFVRGLDPNLGRSITNSWFTDKLAHSPVEAEPITAIFPSLDLAMVVEIILGLFVLLMTYDGVCGEKEVGTLRLVMSFPVPRQWLIFGKLVGISVPILMVFGLPLLLGVAVLLLRPDVNMAHLDALRLVLILLTLGLYLFALMCAGLFASCLSHRSATSFVLLLIFWVFIVVATPRLSLILAEVVHPLPNLREQSAMKSKAWDSVTWVHESVVEWEKKNPNWRQSPEGKEARNLHYWRFREEEGKNREIVNNQFDEWFDARYNTRLNLGLSLARFSPAFACHSAVVRLAGTGIDRHRRFETAFKHGHMKIWWNWYRTSMHLDMLRESRPPPCLY